MSSLPSLANGRSYSAIPGPSVMPDRVLAAMQRAAPNIYGGALIADVAALWPRLRKVAGTKHHVALYIANGHGAWEAASSNLFSRGDKALLIAVGHFGHGWAQSAQAMGVHVDVLDFGRSAGYDLEQIAAALKSDKNHEIKALMCCHVDTASGIRSDIAALGQLLKDLGHPALLVVDCIASLGCDPFYMDDWGVDVMVSASQKGLMTPPGIGFVWFSERAYERCKTADLRTPYWDWEARAFASELWRFFGGTPPTHHLFALQEALSMIEEEGLENVWARHRRLASGVWAAFDTWGQGHGHIGLNVADPALRASGVTAARLGAPEATRLREWCEREAGVILGIGLGMAAPSDPAWHGFLRVGHMGHVNAHMTLGVLSVMEAGMQALQIPHQSGAIEAAAKAMVG